MRLRSSSRIKYLLFMLFWRSEAQCTDLIENFSLSAGLGAPEVVSLEGAKRWGDSFQAYAHTGVLFFPIQKGQGNIAALGFELGGRLSPLSKWWYLGLGAGYRRLSARLDLSGLTLDGQSVIEQPIGLILHAFYLKPAFGVRWQITEKIWMQSEFGIQVPIFGIGTVIEGKDAFLEPGKDSLSSNQQVALEKLSLMSLPAFTAIRLVWIL